MPDYPFQINNQYTKNDIYEILSVPSEKQRGNWDTGYNRYNGDWFIFCNIGNPGRTGHDYENKFLGDDLLWFGKTGSTIDQPAIDSMLQPSAIKYIFYRNNDRAPFTYAGKASVKTSRDVSPVEILWQFTDLSNVRPEVLAEEITEPNHYFEGAVKKITVNIFERNPQARNDCIKHFKLSCVICGFNFEKIYGEIGKNFIHVHHLKPLSEINANYLLNPIEDLRPVCPNCHAMLHRRKPPLTVDELKEIINISEE